MATSESKALTKADARLGAAEKRLKQARANRALVVQRERKAKDTRRTRTNVLVGVAVQYRLKNAKTIEERDKLQAFIRKLVDEAFMGQKEVDHAAVVAGLEELATDLPPLENDRKK